MPHPAIDLMVCAPEELATWLLTHRFQENAMDVASFLLNCTSTLPNAEEIPALLFGDNDGEIEGEEDDDEAEVKFDNNITGAASASAETVSKATSTDTSTESSPPTLPVWVNDNTNSVEVSCINPRGKFLLNLNNNQCALANPKTPQEQIHFSATNIEHIVWFRKPEDYKKLRQLSSGGGNGKGNAKDLPGHMVLICLGDGIMFRNKALKQVCFQLPSYPHPSATTASADDVTEKSGNNKQLLTEKYWWNEFSKTLLANTTKGGIIRVHATMDKPELNSGKNNFVFRSEGESGRTTTTESMPYVGCYQGFNDGALFPLSEGLLFFKPPIFVPRSKLASISCGRGSGGSRFVDLVAQLDVDTTTDEQEGKKGNSQSDTLEFTNIHRDELNGLNDYIHQILIPAMQLDADGADEAIEKVTKSIDCNGDEGNADGSDDDDNDVAVAAVVHSCDDSDENDSNSDAELEEGKKRRRPTRAAAKSAREITRTVLQSATCDNGDSDDSVEFQEEEDSSDGSDDTDGSDDQTDVSDEDSSSESGDFEEDDMDDSDNDRKKKKARVG